MDRRISTVGHAGDRPSGRALPTVVFRPVAWLRIAVLAALLLWVGVFLLLCSLDDAPNRAFYSVAFFIALFGALGLFYNSTAIEVTDSGVIERSLATARLVDFSDIVRIDVRPGFLQTNYAVLARRGLLSFTSLVSGHERLMRLIVERARLAPI